MSDADTLDGVDSVEDAYPPLDVVDSRWWYWIAAYVVASILFVPLIVIALLTFLVPAIVVGPGAGPTVGAPIRILGLLFAILLFGFAILSFTVFVLLPVALYMDARQVGRADLGWKPDPMLYGILGLLQFFLTPIIGLFVALYYLYRRHEHIGVP